MKNKKLVIFSVLFACVCLITILNFENEEEINYVSFDGKVDGFSDLEDLENSTSIIVRGYKTDENLGEIYKSDANDQVIAGYTKSSFKITKVYKNDENSSDIEVDNEITISEQAFFDEESNSLYTINNYENMTIGNEYVLFLTPVDLGMYAPRSVTFGKVPMELSKTNKVKKAKSLYAEADDDIVSTIIKEAQNKYLNE